MKLSDLEQLEQEYQQRGYRVAFERLCWNQSLDRQIEDWWELDTLPSDGEAGCVTQEEAQALLERFQRVASPRRFRDLRVIGPDELPVISTPLIQETVPAAEQVISLLLEPIDDVQETLTLLTHNGVLCIVGDSGGRCHLLEWTALQERGNFRTRAHSTSFGQVIVDGVGHQIDFREYQAEEHGLSVRAGTYQPEGSDTKVWFVIRSA